MARTPKPKPGQQVPVKNNPGIYKRTDAEGNVVYLVRVYNPETQSRTNFNAESLEEAQQIKRGEEAAKKARGRGRGVETVETWSKRWLKVCPRPKESTNIHNEGMIRPFVADFGDRRLDSITFPEAHLWAHGGPAGPDLEQTAIKWARSKRDKDGTVIVRGHMSCLQVVKAFFNDAVKHGVGGLQSNPFANVKRTTRARAEQVRQGSFLTAEEVAELAALARRLLGAQGGFVVGPMIQIAAYTGLRPGELFALRPEDVDMAGETVHVRRAYDTKTKTFTAPKSKAGKRTVAMLPQARQAFEKLELDQCEPNEPIFRTARGVPLTQRTIHYYWDPVRKAFAETRPEGHWLRERMEQHAPKTADDESRRNGVPGDLDFYELRHFYGSLLAAHNISAYDIAKQMGHEDGGKLAMETYIHTHSDDSDRRVKEQFSQIRAA